MQRTDMCACGGKLSIYAQNIEKNQGLYACIDCDKRYLYNNGKFEKLTKSEAKRIKFQAEMTNV